MNNALPVRVTRARALAQTAQQLARDTNVFVLGELANLRSASAPNPSSNNPDGGEDVLFNELVAEMQDLQQPSTGQTKCYEDFVNNTSGIREFLASKRGKTLTAQDKQKVINAVTGAIETYDRCMSLPRTKRRPGGVAGGN